MRLFLITRLGGWPVGVVALAFLALTIATGFGATAALDQRATQLVQGQPARWLDWVAATFSLVGTVEVSGSLVLLCAGLRWGRRAPGRVAVVLGLLALGTLLEVVLKQWLPHASLSSQLQRPAIFTISLSRLESPNSYPSGHALRWSFLTALVVDGARRRLVTVGMVATAGLMAVTRVYLGAHWLSDVLGGALLGWALAGIAYDPGPAARRLIARASGGVAPVQDRPGR